MPATTSRPLVVIVYPAVSALGSRSSSPTAYDVTFSSLYTAHALPHSVTYCGKDARLAQRHKLRIFKCTVRTALRIVVLADGPTLGFTYISLALDSLGTSAAKVIDTVKQNTTIISMRSASSHASMEAILWQKLSFAVWFSVTAAILVRTPTEFASLM